MVPMSTDRERWLALAAPARVARLGTRSARHADVDLVPVTFVIDGDRFVTAVDHKPKTTRALARLANVRAHGRATALVDHWDEDWGHLWWVRLRGPAEVVAVDDPGVRPALEALAHKYAPYRTTPPEGPCIVVHLEHVRGWTGA